MLPCEGGENKKGSQCGADSPGGSTTRSIWGREVRLWSASLNHRTTPKDPGLSAALGTSVNGALPTRPSGMARIQHESVNARREDGRRPCGTGTPHCLVNGQADAPSWRTQAGESPTRQASPEPGRRRGPWVPGDCAPEARPAAAAIDRGLWFPHDIIRNIGVSVMILPQVHLRKPCYDFYFL